MKPENPLVRRNATLWLLALALPILAGAASVFVHVDPAAWFSMPEQMRRGATADALLYIAAAAVIAAPLAGVIAGPGRTPHVHVELVRLCLTLDNGDCVTPY